MTEQTPDKFWSRVDRTGDCWLWTGPRDSMGYGKYSHSKRLTLRAHRYAWERVNGPIPAGLVLDHLCRNPTCVRPDHLEPVTNRENVLRGIGPSAANARKTHCKRGHEFTPENTRTTDGRRQCWICHRVKRNRSVARIRGAQRAARRAEKAA